LDATATSASEIGIAFQKVGGTAGALGIPFDKVGAMIAVISSKTRESAETIGDALKSIFARLENLKEKGFDQTDGTKVNQVSKALATIGVNLMDQQGQFRNFGTVFDELGAKWGSLDSRQKAYIATTVAGTYQQARFFNVMEGYPDVLKLTEQSLNSAGTATSKYNLYLEGTEAHLDRLKDAWAKIWSDSFNSEGINSTIEKLISLAKFIDSIVNKFGALPITVGLATTAFILFNKELRTGMMTDYSSFGKFFSTAKEQYKGLTEVTEQGVIQTTAFQRAQASMAYASEATGVKVRSLATSLTGLETVFKGLRLVIGAFLPALAIAGISMLVEKILSLHEESSRLEEEAQKRVDQSTESYSKNKSQINDLLATYNKLDSHKNNLSTDEQKQYNDIQNELNRMLPTLTENIDINGQAHLKSSKKIQEELDYTEKLVKAKQDLANANLDADLKKNSNDIDSKTQEKKQVQFEIDNGNFNATLGEYTPLSDEELQKAKMKLLVLDHEIASITDSSKAKLADWALSVTESFSGIKIDDNLKKQISDVIKSLDFTQIKPDEQKGVILGLVNSMTTLKDALKHGDGQEISIATEDFDKMTASAHLTSDQLKIVKDAVYGVKDAIKQSFTDIDSIQKKATETFDNFVKDNTDLSSAYASIQKGNDLSGKQIADLITKYPKLSSAVENHSGKLSLNKKAVEDLMKAKDAEFQVDMKSQQTELDNMEKAITAKYSLYDKELSMIQSVAEAKDASARITEDQLNNLKKAGLSIDYTVAMVYSGNNDKELTALGRIKEARNSMNATMGVTVQSLAKENDQTAKNVKGVDAYDIALKALDTTLDDIKNKLQEYPKYSQEYRDALNAEKQAIQEKNKLLKEQLDHMEATGQGAKGSKIVKANTTNGGDTQSAIWNYFAGKGLNAGAIAGIMGNLQQENDFSTADTTGGLGIAQWLDGRRSGLMKYAEGKGLSPTSLQAQLEWLWKELSSGSGGASLDKLNGMNASDSALYFSKAFERPSEKYANNDKRMEYAGNWYSKFSGVTGDNIKTGNDAVSDSDYQQKVDDIKKKISDNNKILKQIPYEIIQSNEATFERANTLLDQDIEGSKSHMTTFNQASKGYRDELSQQIPLMKQKQDNLHTEADYIRGVLEAQEDGTAQDKLTATQIDELKDKLQKLGVEWWNLQGNVKKANDEMDKSKFDEVIQKATDAIDMSKEKSDLLSGQLDLTSKGNIEERSVLVNNLNNEYLSQISTLQDSIQKLKDLSVGLDKNGDAWKRNQKQILGYENQVLSVQKSQASLKDSLFQQIADILSSQEQADLQQLKNQHDATIKSMQENLKSITDQYDTQIKQLQQQQKLLDQQYNTQDKIRKLNEVDDKINQAMQDGRYEYIDASGKIELTYDKAKVADLKKQRDDLIEQYRRDDLKQALQEQIDTLQNAKDTQTQTLQKQIDDTKTLYEQQEQDEKTRWDTIIDEAKNGTLTMDELMNGWYKNTVNGLTSFKGDSAKLVDQIKTLFESIGKMKLQMPQMPQIFQQQQQYQVGVTTSYGGDGGFDFTPSGATGAGSVGGSRSDMEGVYDASGNFTAGEVSIHHDGGIVGVETHHDGNFVSGKSPSRLAQLANKLFNTKPDEQMVKALKGEMFVPEKNIPNFFTNMQNLINSYIPSGGSSVVDQSQIININNPTIKADNPMELFNGLNTLIRSNQT
jgi:hypothetical protein